MNRTRRSVGRKSETLSDRVSSWRQLIERCGRKPTRKRVHALRVITLRIQSEVEDGLNELPSASHEVQAMVRFGKLAEKLRDALGAVRELDVWMGKLSGLRDSLCGTQTYVPRSNRETCRQLERLERKLMKKRERAAVKLVKEIERRQDDLLVAATDIVQATSGRADAGNASQALKLLNEFAGIVAEFPVFDEKNLHDFRKRIKKIRYVAEIHSSGPACGRVAEQLKNVQGAIGEWHDWQVLARTAKHGKRARKAEAGDLLGSLTSESFEAAIATCDGVLRRIADLKREIERSSNVPRKAPTRDESDLAMPLLKLA